MIGIGPRQAKKLLVGMVSNNAGKLTYSARQAKAYITLNCIPIINSILINAHKQF